MVFSKWGGRPHYEYDALRLGSDEHGVWLGVPAGTPMSRPGVAFSLEVAFVVLVPEHKAFAASFYQPTSSPPSGWVEVYVDITTPPVWADGTVHLVDLDLDVVRGRTGRVWVDDEDEFADHRVRFGYPGQVIQTALASCDEVRLAVENRTPPYDGRTGAHWLEQLEAAMMTP